MQLDRLLSRIRAALQDFATEFEQRALAAEYTEWCTTAARRLEQIVPLIRGGQDYAALQIAEAPPPVLDLVRQLSFAEVEPWRAFCKRHNLPVPEPFDEQTVDLVNQLYGKKIGETHPLYRDYRQAIRTRDEQKALRVLQSIRRVNPDDANAHAEHARLARKLYEKKSPELAAAVATRDPAKIFAVMEAIELDGWSGRDQDPVWRKAMDFRDEQHPAIARERCLVLATHLQRLKKEDQWEETLPVLAEWDSLRGQFQFSLPPEIETAAKSVREWASGRLAARQRDEERQRLWQNLNARLNELAETRSNKLSRKDLAMAIEELQGQTAMKVNLPPDLSGRLDEQLRRLHDIVRRRRNAMFTLAGVAATAAVAAISVFFWMRGREETRQAETILLRQYLQAHAADQLTETVHDIDTKYAYLINDPDIAGLLAKARAFLNQRNAVRDRFDSELAQLDQAATPDISPAKLANLLESLETLDRQAADLTADDAIIARTKLAERRVKWGQQLTGVREDRANRLAVIATRAEAVYKEKLNTLGTSDAIAAAIAEIRTILADAEKVQPSTDHESPVEIKARARLTDLQSKIDTLASANRNAQADRALLPLARSMDEYRAPIERLAINPLLTDPTVAAAHALLDRKPEWSAAAQSILLPDNPEMWSYLQTAKAAKLTPSQNVQSEDIAFARLVNNDVLGNTYRADLVEFNNGIEIKRTPVFLAGEIKEEPPVKSATLEEIRQKGVIISPNGQTTDKSTRWIKFEGQNARGERFENAQLAPESRLVARLKQAHDPRSGGIREPLLRVLDDVRSSPNASPILKAYLQQEITKIMQARPYDWGLGFSPSALADAKELEKISGGRLLPADWLFPTNPRLADELKMFYDSIAAHNYYAEADKNLQNALRLSALPVQFGGYIDLDQAPKLFEAPTGASSLWGLDMNGKWRALLNVTTGQVTKRDDAPTPARLTPLFYTRDSVPAATP